MKTIGGGRQLRHIGRERSRLWLTSTAAASDLVCIAKLEPAAVYAIAGRRDGALKIKHADATSITPLLGANRDANASLRTRSLPQPTFLSILLGQAHPPPRTAATA